MLFIIALVLAAVFVCLCDKPLKKHPYVFYAVAAVLAVGSIIYSFVNPHGVPAFLSNYVIALFTRGAFATALWCVVMWSAAFPNGSAPIKKLMPIRGELSIFAAILTLGHNIGFGRTYLVRLFTDAGSMAANYVIASVLTIILLVIMLPLTVMSFPQIRKKMNAKLWKKIQRTAYLFYALVYVHVLVLYYPMARAGRAGILFNILVYSIVFIGYAVCRIRKQIVLRKKPESKAVLNVVCVIVFLVLTGVVVMFARAENRENVTAEGVPAQVNTLESQEAETDEVTEETMETSEASEVTETTETSETTESTEETEESTEETDETAETEPEENPEEVLPEEDPEEVPPPEEVVPEEPQPEPQPEEPVYVYRNGVYSASAYGYDGDVFVEVTIENDVILSITAWTEEIDPWYFDTAQGSVISQILASQNAGVDAVSGATYSSNAIMSAVQQALNAARN